MVSKNTLVQDVFSVFFSIAQEITSITLSDGSIRTIQRYTSEFPDTTILERKDYPILEVSKVSISYSELTLTKKRVEGSIGITIFDTKAESVEKFADAIHTKIREKSATLRSENLYQIRLENTEEDTFIHGEIKVHSKRLNYSFVFIMG